MKWLLWFISGWLVIKLTNKEDEIRLQYHRCPYCGSPVKSSWNLKTTGLVYCKAKCPQGKYLMKPEECDFVDNDFMGDVEFLEDVEGVG